MWKVLEPLGAQTKLFSPYTKPRGDSFGFRLHYRTTFVLVMGCCLTVTAVQYLGGQIQCLGDREAFPKDSKVLNTYCYISSTFLLPQTMNMDSEEVGHAGLGPVGSKTEKRYYNYYMWVPYVLFLQAISFYFPHWLWKMVQSDKVANVLQGLNYLIVKEEERKRKEDIMVDYLHKSWGSHTLWAWKYTFCETLNLVNVVLQLIFTNCFLGGEFFTYGTRAVDFMRETAERRTDPMYEVFPLITKCTFHRYGSSGSIETIDALCIMTINVLNERVYLTLWFWFVILLGISTLTFIFRVATIYFPSVREKILRARGGSSASLLSYQCDFGDWYLLYNLCQNMNGPIFEEVMKKLQKKMADRNYEHPEIKTK